MSSDTRAARRKRTEQADAFAKSVYKIILGHYALESGMSNRMLARRLNMDKVKSASGKIECWDETKIRLLLKRAGYQRFLR